MSRRPTGDIDTYVSRRCSDTGKLICLIWVRVRVSLYKSLTGNNCEAWLTTASCSGFFSWLSCIRVGWLISVPWGFNPLRMGWVYCLAPEALLQGKADGAWCILGNARRVWAPTLPSDPPLKGLVPHLPLD